MKDQTKRIYGHLPLGKLCAMITKPYFGALTLMLEHSGIEKHFSVLILLENGKDCTQQFISDTLQIDKVSMVKIIDDFSKKGYVKRVQNPKDRRAYFIELTPKGDKLLVDVHKATKELSDTAFKGFSAKEKKKFYESLVQVHHNIKHLPYSHITVDYRKNKNTK